MLVPCTVNRQNSTLLIKDEIICIHGQTNLYQFQINLDLQINWMPDCKGFTIYSIHVRFSQGDGLSIFNLLATKVMYCNYHLFFVHKNILGQGGQSEGVYESFRVGECHHYATKILMKKGGIPLEIKLLKKFNHENIIKPRFFFQDESKYYIVFDKLLNLTTRDEYQLQNQFKQLLQATEYIHSQGYIHRDIKPRNIMQKQNQQVQLIDLGLVIKQSESELKQSGTVGYTAPEIFRGPYYTQKADLFSLGAVFYEMLYKKPLIGENNTRLRNQFFKLKNYELEDVSDFAKDLLKKLLIEDPNQRISIQQSLRHAYFDQEDGAQDTRTMSPKLISSFI